MSPYNGLQGQVAGRTPARTPTQEQTAPAWGQPQQAQWTQAPQAAAGGYDPQGYGQPGYGAQGYANQGYGAHPGAAPAATFGQQDYQYPQQSQDAHYANGLAANPNPLAPQFEPYVAGAPQQAPRAAAQPAYQPQVPQQGYGQLQQGYSTPEPRSQGHAAGQWPAQPQHDPRGFDLGGYAPQAQPATYRQEPLQQEHEPSFGEWNQPQAAAGDLGYAEPAGGELDPAYAEEESQDYEADEPRRGRRPLMIAAALAGAILIGGGLAKGYQVFLGRGPGGDPPVIKSASEPSKIKPAEAGGKQFAHTDSKVMGRLGDGTAAASVATGEPADANGTRKVSTVVVGRDGSIQAPPPAPAGTETVAAAEPPAAVNVPGMMVVDGLGTSRAAAAAPAAAPQKLVVAPPAAPQKPVTIAKAVPAAPAQPEATGSIDQAAAPAPAPAPKKKKVVDALGAVAAPAAPASGSVATTASGGNGYVAVLASMPRSDSSRIDALKRFADMQQKYGSVLGGKTPDVAEANLGAKGAYHRLVVGPPGSREQASTVCSQLKTQGYADCWVTSY